VIELKADAIFEGGGVRGIGIVGALTYMEGCDYQWQRVAGSSVGALIASLISAGYTAKEMRRILIQTNFLRFLDKDRIQRIPILGKPLGFVTQNAIYSGDYLEKWISALLKRKGVEKFKDITVNGECPLKIVASDITRRCILILPDDLPKYDIDPMEFRIARAVRMSISIPFYFKPVKLNHKTGTSYIVDGCISCSYPITIFDTELPPKRSTIGFKFDDPRTTYTARGKADPLSFLFDIASTMANRTSVEYMSEKNRARSIIIPTGGVEVTDFDISREKSVLLFKYGFRSAMDFIKTWDFEDYVRKYRSTNQPIL
jgi:NTE family protein